MIREVSLSRCLSSIKNRSFEPLDPGVIAREWQARFGIPEEVFSGLTFFKRGRMVWAFSETMVPPFVCETVGLRIMSMREHPWKPTTYALQLWGRFATKNIVELDDSETRTFFAGETVQLLAERENAAHSSRFVSTAQFNIIDSLETGYVIAAHRGAILGCGLYSRGRLISQLPKERRISGDGI